MYFTVFFTERAWSNLSLTCGTNAVTTHDYSPLFPTVRHYSYYSYSTTRFSGFPDTRVLFCCSCELKIADIHLASLADSLRVRHAFLPHVGEERVTNPKRVCEGGQHSSDFNYFQAGLQVTTCSPRERRLKNCIAFKTLIQKVRDF